EEIREKTIDAPAALARVVPAMTGHTVGRDTFFSTQFRGLPGVRTYMAEVPAVLNTGAFFDLQNVQALVGPQGTLFGLNATGGAILLEPKRPTDKFEGWVEGTIGNYNQRVLRGA